MGHVHDDGQGPLIGTKSIALHILGVDKREPRLPGGWMSGFTGPLQGQGGGPSGVSVAGVSRAVSCGAVSHCSTTVQAVVVCGDRGFVACLSAFALDAPVDVSDSHEDLPSFNSIIPHGG